VLQLPLAQVLGGGWHQLLNQSMIGPACVGRSLLAAKAAAIPRL
jgi:hypothetical protein